MDLRTPGKWMQWGFARGGLALLAVACSVTAAYGQESSIPEGEIYGEISTTFLTAYREGAWIPVDVIVRNNKADYSGWVEVQVETLNGTASPVYRVPAESPKGSTKRFRVYCRMKGANGLKAMLYHRRRPVLDFPATITLSPIGPNDLIGLVLDDEPGNYGFIFTAIQRQFPGRGYHRHELRTRDVPQLPDYPQCYESYAMVIVGKVDPNQVGLRQRELLLRYVKQGGVLVVCAGENAGRLRGTWVEEVSGVSIGAQVTVDEAALARAVFKPMEQRGARAGEDVLLTELTAEGADVLVWGTDPVMATRRALGRGQVVVVGVDASSKALQECEGFLRIWAGLAEMHRDETRLNYARAAETASQMLPAATGIRVYPWSSVLTYLLLYFFIGIVGNWLFWSWFKRREMAWVCLVFFSIGFTAYALIYGTAGRAKATELAQLEVLRVHDNDGPASLYGIVGVLSARTARYTFDLTNQYGLVSDPWSSGFQGYMPGPRGFMGGVSGFDFVYDQPPRVQDMRVGASVMRVLEVESDVDLPGGVDGALVWDAAGVHGTLSNNTGLTIPQPFLLIEGRKIALQGDGTTWDVSIPPERLAQPDVIPQTHDDYYNRYPAWDRVNARSLQSSIETMLIGSPAADREYNTLLGPYVCGWASGRALGSVKLEEAVAERISHTFVVADVAVDRRQATIPKRIPLTVLTSELPLSTNPWRRSVYDNMQQLDESRPTTVEVVVPPHYLENADAVLEFELYWSSDTENGTIVFAPENTEESWPAEHGTGQQKINLSDRYGQPYQLSVYRVDDLVQRYDREKSWVRGIVRWQGPGTRGRRWGRFYPVAHLLVSREKSDNGDWTSWQ